MASASGPTVDAKFASTLDSTLDTVLAPGATRRCTRALARRTPYNVLHEDSHVSMKVFNLCCERDHAFEGWFASAEAFETQLASGLIECPVCADKAVRRLPSAPRLNLSSSPPAQQPANEGAPADAPPEQLRAMWHKVARYIRENTEDVGARFAEEARRMHYDEAPERAIRGVASRREAAELADEGIEVISFPMPEGPDGPLQ